jgi:LPXTG-motif cell wall-anchored protein
MSRKAFPVVLTLFLALLVGIAASAQNTQSPQPQAVVPMQLNPYYLYPSNVQPVPMLTTPTASFDSPAPTAGISNAGRAGISDNPGGATGVTSTLPPSTMVYTNMQPTVAVPAVAAPEATGGAPPEAAANESGGRQFNDLGPSYYSDALPAAGTVSLGEVAAKFKASRPAVNARMLTNDDVGKMVASQTGVTLARNMPPLGPGVSGLMGQPQSAQAPSSQAGQSAPNSVTAQGGTPPPAQATQPSPGASAANATTPQINQHPQANDTQGGSRLPATSTWLPLLGFLGAMSGAAGLWFRRFRR